MEPVPSPLVGLVRRVRSASMSSIGPCAGTAKSSDRARARAAFVVTVVATSLALVMTAYGVGSDRKAVALIGLASTVVVVAALVFSASSSSHGREVLLAANEELQRRNADLEALHLAVLTGLDVIDQETHGRLLELIQEAGDELAVLVDETLDDGMKDS
jgi:hypothetical protein